MMDDLPDFLTPPRRDVLRDSRTAHAVRIAGRPHRVLYLEGPDEPPPADPRDGCACHDADPCPEVLRDAWDPEPW